MCRVALASLLVPLLVAAPRQAQALAVPEQVELLPGVTLPPADDRERFPDAPPAGGPDDPDDGPSPGVEVQPLPEGVPPPPRDGVPNSNATLANHINYEALYYTQYANISGGKSPPPMLNLRSISTHTCLYVRGVPSSVRSQLGLSTFYQKYTEAYGIPVLSSSAVPDAALRRACYITRFLFADHPAVRDSYRNMRGRMAVIGRYERTTQIPEHSFLGPAWDSRARGLGATEYAPVSTIGEENLLRYGYPTDRWFSEDIGLHEFAHGLHILGAKYAWPAWNSRLQQAYSAAMARGLWGSTYAATNHIEYFAEGVQKYFYVDAYSQYPNGVHNSIDTREKLYGYDRNLYNVVQEMFPCGNTYISRRQDGFQPAGDAQKLKLSSPTCQLEGGGGGGGGTTTTTSGTTTTTTAATTTTSASCRDYNTYCYSWAVAGYCSSNPGYMTVYCRRSCGLCGACADNNANCASWASRGECERNPGYMLVNCRRSCNRC